MSTRPYGLLGLLSRPLRLRPAYHDQVSSQDSDGRRPDYPSWGGEPGEGPDILEQGSDRPPARGLTAVRWRRPPAVAIILGITGLLAGLGAGYAAGTLHAEKATVSSARSGATASSAAISQVLIAGTSGQFQLQCSATGVLRQLDTSVTNGSTPAAHGTVVIVFPAAGPKLTCPQVVRDEEGTASAASGRSMGHSVVMRRLG